ncbi:MAG: tetratricopeptide repeat protein [Gemmataceae bacterium]|nr:tetratricopeptide repeat protein [Gemmataceae bacterium]
MSEENKPIDGSMVPAGRGDLAPVAAANSLVLRGLADLAQGRLLQVEEKNQLLMDEALDCLRLGMIDDAIGLFDEVIRRNSDYWLAYLCRGEAWLRKDRTGSDTQYCDNAIRDFSEAIRIEPETTYAFKERGIAWYLKKDYDNAIDDFDEAIRRFSTEGGNDVEAEVADTYSGRGKAWLQKGDYGKAIKDYDEAIRFNPKKAIYFFIRGEAWLRIQENTRAIEDFTEAIRLDPKDVTYYTRRSSAWSIEKDHDKAIKDYDEAIRLDPSDSITFNNRGFAWAGKKDYDRAIQDYDEAIRLAPNDSTAYNNRGHAWAAKNHQDNANRDFDKAHRLDRRRRTLPVPNSLEINIPGELSVLTLGRFVALAQTPGILEISLTAISEAHDRLSAERKERYERLLALKAPEIILQNEIRIRSRYDAWKDVGDRPEDFAYQFKAKEANFDYSEFEKAVVSLSALTQLEYLDLTGSSVTDTGLAQLRVLPNLLVLRLGSCHGITDHGLAHIAALPHLEGLVLAGCLVTDHGLIHLSRLKKLADLSLAGCSNITQGGVAALKAALPRCEINCAKE